MQHGQVAGIKRKAAPGGGQGAGASKVAGAFNELDEAVRQQEAARAIARAQEAAAAHAAEGSGQPFIPSKTFAGARAGYYFSNGEKGVGYYLDAHAQAAQEAEQRVSKELDADELLRQAEEAAADEEVLELLDIKGLRRLILSFDRKFKANSQMRMKHADQAEKFMDSEVELASEIKRLFVIAGSPELYPELINLNAVPTILELLRHENTDIAADAVDLLRELTDVDADLDADEEAEALVDCLLKNNVLELLVQRLVSFNEANDDEAAGVFNTLGVLENLAEVKPEVAEAATEKTKLMRWLLARLKPREFSSVKQSVSEVLGILTQTSTKNQEMLGAQGGIDVLLTSIAPFRSRDPGSHEDEEFMENIFDTLTSCLLVPENKQRFVEAEGVQLMLLILKRKKSNARAAALKTLDFAMTKYAPAVEQFVNFTDDQGGLLGLKVLFSIFIGKTKLKKKGEATIEKEAEERTVSIISSIFQGVPRGAKRDRIAGKFVENEFEKCDRLMELFFRYRDSVDAAEGDLGGEDEDDGDDGDDSNGQLLLLRRMEAGLYTLQQAALVVGYLWSIGDVGIRKRLLMLLHQKRRALSIIRDALQEYHDSIGSGDSEEFSKQKRRVMRLIDGMRRTNEEDQ